MGFVASPLQEGLGFGSLVTDLAREAIADPETRRALYDLWIDRGVVVFRGLPDDADTLIELSRIFGNLMVHPFKSISGQSDIQVFADIRYDPERGDIVRIGDGPSLGAWLPWHFDQAYFHHINHGGILRAVELSTAGGRTGFIDGRDAYERLPEALKREIEDLYVVYRFDGDIAGLRYGALPGVVLERMNAGSVEIMGRIDEWPPVAHPLVFVQPERRSQDPQLLALVCVRHRRHGQVGF